MGLVQRQSIKNSIVNYTGVLVGGISTLFIYPLDWDLYGNIQFILSAALLLNALLSLGSHSLVNKYFPFFESNKGFLTLLFTYASITAILVGILLFLFKNPFSNLLSQADFDVQKINENILFIVPIAICYVYINILRAQSFNRSRIVVPDLISNFSLKFFVPLLIFLSWLNFISFETAGWLLVFYHFIIVGSLMYYLYLLKGLDFDFSVFKRVSKNKHLEMINYMLFNAMNHVGNILIYKIDIIMIGLLLSTTKVGYYSIFLFLSVVIEIPLKAVFQITAPIVSKAMDNKDYTQISKTYKNTSANLYVIGIALFFIIWFNLDTIFKIMTNGEDLIMYKSIFLLLAITKLMDMVTSVNTYIISYSRYYKINTLFIFILAFSNIIMNYYFIEKFDIIGAALSTTISMFIYHTLKTIFVNMKYKIHPFNYKIFFITLLLTIAIFLPYLFPYLFDSIFISGLITLLFSVIFIFTLYNLNITNEINIIIHKYFTRNGY